MRFVWNAFAFCAGLPQPHETRVHRTGVVLDRALEQQVAARARRVVVLERAEVEHLLAVAEVHRELVALGALAAEPRLAAQPGVVAAERDRRRAHGRVAADVGALEAEVPRPRAVLLHREVPQVRVVVDEQLGDRVDEVIGVGRAEAVEHRRLRVLAERDERVRERRAAVAFAPVQDEDRILDHDAGGHLHERAAREERVVQAP